MKNVIIFAVIIIAVLAIMFIFRAPGATNYPLPSTAPASDEIVADDWTRGNPEAAIIITEYSDFQCPACAAYHVLVKQLIEAYGDRILFSYRHFPLVNIHPNAHLAARAAEAAGRQGKFWEMHDLLFKNQQLWQNRQAQPIFISYAKELGLNTDQFETDLDSEIVIARVQRDLAGGQLANVTYTPTFYLNGRKIENPKSLEEFGNLIGAPITTTTATTTEAN